MKTKSTVTTEIKKEKNEHKHHHAHVEKAPVFFKPHETETVKQEININLTVNEDKDNGDSTTKCISNILKCFGK